VSNAVSMVRRAGKNISTTSTVALSQGGPGPHGTPILDTFNRANGGLGSNWTGNPQGLGSYSPAAIIFVIGASEIK
jgi:hypothetical protein